MRILHHLSLLAAAAGLCVLASCGSSGSTAALHAGNQPATPVVADTSGELSFPVESGPRLTSANGGSLTILGKDFLQDKWATVDGDNLVIGPSQGDGHENTSYGMYKFAGLAGQHLTGLQVNALPGDLDMSYYVALADFTHLKWKWFGPVTLPEFQYDFAGDDNHYISPLGNVYFAVATHESNVTTHSFSTLTFDDGNGDGGGGKNPGAPTDLVASDGTFTDHVGLTWHAGDGAQWYEIYRHRIGDDPNVPEWGKIGEAQTTEFSDVNVSAGHVYYYKVRSAAQGGGDHPDNYYSDFSNIDSGYPGAQHDGPPGTPQGLSASDGTYASIVRVTWQVSDGAQWYELFRYTEGQEGGWALVNTTNGHVYEDSDVIVGQIYYYKVRAGRQGDNGNQYSDFSNVDSGYAAEQHGGDTYSISVSINDGFRAGTTVTLLGKSAEPYTVQLGDGGVATFDGLVPGRYVVYPYNAGHQFSNEYWIGEVGPNNPNVTLSFTGGPVVNKSRVWGFVYQYSNDPGTAGWSPIGTGLKAWLDGTQDYHTGQTNADGFYGIGEMPQGTIIVQPVSEHYTFTPTSNHCTVDGEHLPAPLLFVGVGK